MKKILLFVAALACSVASWAQNELSATVAGDQLTVSLTNETSYVAFQMDIALPEGVTVNAITLNEDRLDKNPDVTIAGADNSDFTVAYNVLSGNVLRVVVYNLENREIVDQSGDLFTVSISGYTEGEINIDNIKFVTKGQLEEDVLKATIAAEGTTLRYDLNNSGAEDINDALVLLQYILDDEAPYNAKYDLNADGSSVDISDALVILQYLLTLD